MAARHATRFLNRRAAIPQHPRVRILPVDRECFVDLNVLTCLDASPAENALVRVVAVEGIRLVDSVRFRREWDALMLNREQLRGIVHGAVAIVLVAYGAVEQ